MFLIKVLVNINNSTINPFGQGVLASIIHHLILRRPDFPFFNAVCLGWLQYFPSKEVLSVKFYMNAISNSFLWVKWASFTLFVKICSENPPPK